MERIKDTLGSLINKLEKKATGKGAATREAWAKAAGEKVLGHAYPASFRKGVLMVIVENSSWLYNLTMEKRRIIKIFNENYTGRQKLKEIRFRIGKIDM